jgi:hypothetical protein
MNHQPRPAAAICREDDLAAAAAREVTILPEVIADLLVGLYAGQISRAGQQQGNFP